LHPVLRRGRCPECCNRVQPITIGVRRLIVRREFPTVPFIPKGSNCAQVDLTHTCVAIVLEDLLNARPTDVMHKHLGSGHDVDSM
jgi:hypothetical protein